MKLLDFDLRKDVLHAQQKKEREDSTNHNYQNAGEISEKHLGIDWTERLKTMVAIVTKDFMI